MANNVRRYGLSILYALRQTRAPCSGAQRAPQNAAPCTANPPPCSGAQRAPQTRGPVRHKTAGDAFRPARCVSRAGNRHGEQCSPLRSQHFVRPAPNPVPPVAAHSVRHKMQTCAPQNADPFAAKPRRGHVPAGPVRPSPDERPWRTMFAATVSAGCKHLAARLPQHPPFGIRPQPCSGAQRAPQNRAPCAANPPI